MPAVQVMPRWPVFCEASPMSTSPIACCSYGCPGRLDHVVIFGERHLRRILTLYLLYYNETRTHLGLGKDAPPRRPVQWRRLAAPHGHAAFRRVEVIAGGADAVGLSAKLANSIGHSNALHKACAPVDIEAVPNTDEARRKGGGRCARGTKRGKCINSTALERINCRRWAVGRAKSLK